MKLTVLVENKQPLDPRVKRAHGLSLFIRTEDHTILFDFGPRGDLLLENAAALGIDLSAVDVAVLSHGHNDHSGGLEAFLEMNRSARVYTHRSVFLPHFAQAGEKFNDISADPALPERYGERIVLIEGTYRIDDTLTLVSDVEEAVPKFSTNRTLFEGADAVRVPDDFAHEQSLLIRENGKTALLGGCAHKGITNIIRRAEAVEGRAPDAVFAGFHTTNPGLGVDETPAAVANAGAELKRWPCRYDTGHCTGDAPYEQLKRVLENRLVNMNCGLSFSVE